MATKNKIVEINPLVKANPIDVVALQKDHYLSKEIDATGLAEDLYLIDQDKKVSVYKHPHSVIDSILFGTLTPKGRDLFLYIMYHLPENKDYITLRIADVRANTGISRNSIVSALQSLKGLNIITNKSISVYWVNPHYFFCGNRVKYYRDLDVNSVIVKSVVRKKTPVDESKLKNKPLGKFTENELKGWSKWAKNKMDEQ